MQKYISIILFSMLLSFKVFAVGDTLDLGSENNVKKSNVIIQKGTKEDKAPKLKATLPQKNWYEDFNRKRTSIKLSYYSPNEKELGTSDSVPMILSTSQLLEVGFNILFPNRNFVEIAVYEKKFSLHDPTKELTKLGKGHGIKLFAGRSTRPILGELFRFNAAAFAGMFSGKSTDYVLTRVKDYIFLDGHKVSQIDLGVKLGAELSLFSDFYALANYQLAHTWNNTFGDKSLTTIKWKSMAHTYNLGLAYSF